MESNNQPNNLQEKILRKINAHELVMRPRIYFTLQLAALVLVAVATLLISVFIFNFILFSIRINSEDAFLQFGPRGILAFLYFFPWMLFFADIALVVLLQALLRRFRFGYKIPILQLLLGLVVATIAAGALIDGATGLNDRLLLRADEHGLPMPVVHFYRGARHEPAPGSGFCRCTILSIEGSTLTVQDKRGAATSTLQVVLPQNDPHATTTGLAVGDVVLIAGEEKDGVLQAFGVHKVPKDAARNVFFQRRISPGHGHEIEIKQEIPVY